MQHSMNRRCNHWDYSSPAIYMITLIQENRHRPLLGKVVVDRPSNLPEEILAHCEPTCLGKIVWKTWSDMMNDFPGIRPLYFQLMEEHIHFILHVQQTLERPLGKYIAAFKARCTQQFRQQSNSPTASLFAQGFQDTILFRKGQLSRMFHYLKDNPRRLAVKRLFPDLFRVSRYIPFDTGFLNGVGNCFLLQAPCFYQVQVSRSTEVSSAEFQRKYDEMSEAVSRDAVVVSPCISPGEKALAKIAFQRKTPLIALRNNDFPPLYKPSGVYFDACANGRLLLLAPPGLGYQMGHRKLTRAEACILNSIAQKICGEFAADITYHGIVPTELEKLVAAALQPPTR
jgi:hypothetical protein